MTTYVDPFGSNTIPPANQGYIAIPLSANQTLQWPEFYSGTGYTVAAIMDVTPSGPGFSITLPDCLVVSIGRDLLWKNLGGDSYTVKDNDGNTLATVTAGSAVYFYLTSNATNQGTWGQVAFGVGSSTVNAGALVGYGIKAITTSLNQSHETYTTATGITVDSTYRSKLIICTATGTSTFALDPAATVGSDFFFLFRNAGSGTATINPSGSEIVDGQSTLQVQPGESAMFVTDGAAWFSVGYGRSTLYQFTQLTYDVSAGGPFTLTASEASNKLITFTGNPVGTVTVMVPQVVSVYYLYNNCSTAQSVIFKTSAGAGVTLVQSGRTIAVCDGTYIVAGVSVSVASTVSLVDGSVSAPALNFASSTNTGLYLYNVTGIGFAVGGVASVTLDGTGNFVAYKQFSNTTGSIAANTPGTFTQTWNNGAVTFTGLFMNITDTASNAASLLEDLQVGGISKFSVNKAGNAVIAGTLGVTGAATLSANLAVNGTAITTSSTTFTALAGATTLLTLGGTGASAVLAVPSTLEASGTTGALTVAGGVYVAKKLNVVGDSVFSSTGAIRIPAGTTGQRTSGTVGDIRYNSSLGTFEGYGSAWGSIGGGATGGGADTVFQENQLIVTTSYTLTTGKSAMSVGPITINGGAAVTIPSGYRWVVI